MDFSEGQKAKLIKYLLMGLGGGAAANLSLNLFSYLRDKAAEANESEEERTKLTKGPKVYEIDPSEFAFLNKSASDNSTTIPGDTMTQALAVLLGAAGLVGGYKLGDIAHDKFKRDEVEEQNKAELENYYKNLYLLRKARQAKTASERKMTKVATPLSSILGTGLGVLLLTSLGSALAARSYMKKEYPKLDLQKVLKRDTNSLFLDAPDMPIFVEREQPKKVTEPNETFKTNESVSLDSDEPRNLNKDKNEQSINDDDDPFSRLEKLSFEKCASEVNEALITLCYEFEKQGKEGSVTNLVKAASMGFGDTLYSSLDKYNKDYTIFDIADDLANKYIKTASEDSKLKDQIAITWLASDPAISSAIMPQIAAEFIDHTPLYSKIASEVGDNYDEDAFAKLITASVVKSRGETFKDLDIPNKKIAFDQSLIEDVSDFSDCLAALLRSPNSVKENLKDIF